MTLFIGITFIFCCIAAGVETINIINHNMIAQPPDTYNVPSRGLVSLIQEMRLDYTHLEFSNIFRTFCRTTLENHQTFIRVQVDTSLVSKNEMSVPMHTTLVNVGVIVEEPLDYLPDVVCF
jgi:hypothetical protein